MSKPLVSIITPCYNGEKYISNFLDSVISQTYPSVELIIIDDGSTDGTKSIIESKRYYFEKKGYKLVYLYQENQGQAAAVNLGLKVFNGEYLMWVDSDDVLYEENISKKVEFLEKNPDYGFVLCKAERVNENDLDFPLEIIGRSRPAGDDNLFKDILLFKLDCYAGINMVRRTSILKSIPSLHIYEGREGQNFQLFLPLAHMYKCGYIEDVLCKIVTHKDSHSQKKRKYDQLVSRRRGMCDIQIHTIDNLVDMSFEDKEYWKNVIEIDYQKAILYLSIINFKGKSAKESKELIIRLGGTIDFIDDVLKSYFFAVIRFAAIIKNKLITLIKRILKNDKYN